MRGATLVVMSGLRDKLSEHSLRVYFVRTPEGSNIVATSEAATCDESSHPNREE